MIPLTRRDPIFCSQNTTFMAGQLKKALYIEAFFSALILQKLYDMNPYNARQSRMYSTVYSTSKSLPANDALKTARNVKDKLTSNSYVCQVFIIHKVYRGGSSIATINVYYRISTNITQTGKKTNKCRANCKLYRIYSNYVGYDQAFQISVQPCKV